MQSLMDVPEPDATRYNKDLRVEQMFDRSGVAQCNRIHYPRHQNLSLMDSIFPKRRKT